MYLYKYIYIILPDTGKLEECRKWHFTSKKDPGIQDRRPQTPRPAQTTKHWQESLLEPPQCCTVWQGFFWFHGKEETVKDRSCLRNNMLRPAQLNHRELKCHGYRDKRLRACPVDAMDAMGLLLAHRLFRSTEALRIIWERLQCSNKQTSYYEVDAASFARDFLRTRCIVVLLHIIHWHLVALPVINS